jgi:hypothetical protein
LDEDVKRFLLPVFLALALMVVASAAVAVSFAVKCPGIIALRATKIYSPTNSKYVCFKSAADAKKSGYKSETSLKKTWRTVTNFSGAVDKTTDPFTINASPWRMRWTHPGTDDNFAVVVYDANTNAYKKLVVNTIGATLDSSNYYGAGRFYLDISGDSDWTVEIQEYR